MSFVTFIPKVFYSLDAIVNAVVSYFWIVHCQYVEIQFISVC